MLFKVPSQSCLQPNRPFWVGEIPSYFIPIVKPCEKLTHPVYFMKRISWNPDASSNKIVSVEVESEMAGCQSPSHHVNENVHTAPLQSVMGNVLQQRRFCGKNISWTWPHAAGLPIVPADGSRGPVATCSWSIRKKQIPIELATCWGYPLPVMTGGFWTLSIHEDVPLPRVDYGSGYHICRDKHTRTYYIGSLFHAISPLKNPYNVGPPQF